MKILSLIVPSYNSEGFLDTCIPSFLHPDVVEALDIIIVNDGSVDNTVSVAEAYCKKYPNSVRLINQENKGHGGALNTGCAAAVGKYLKVIDADDWVETENLPAFVNFLRGCESDVVLSHHYTVDISTKEIKKWKSYPETFEKAYTFDEIMPQWKNFDRSLTFHGITYNTAFYHKHNFRLSEHVFYEDHEFATFPCCHARGITPVDLFIYDYRIGDVQQSVSDSNQLKRLGHTETVLRRLVSEYHKLSADCPGKAYVQMKAQGLLLSYLTTVMLVEPKRRAGRAQGKSMMAFFREELPETYELAGKQYRIIRLMNLLGVRKKGFEKLLRSKLYKHLRGSHDFD